MPTKGLVYQNEKLSATAICPRQRSGFIWRSFPHFLSTQDGPLVRRIYISAQATAVALTAGAAAKADYKDGMAVFVWRFRPMVDLSIGG